MSERQFRIKQMRERAGMNQQEAADALGVKKTRYGAWERETNVLNFKDAIAIADLFHCTLDELAGRESQAPRRVISVPPEALEGESTLVGWYRVVDDKARHRILRSARNEIEDMESDIREKRERSA